MSYLFIFFLSNHDLSSDSLNLRYNNTKNLCGMLNFLRSIFKRQRPKELVEDCGNMVKINDLIVSEKNMNDFYKIFMDILKDIINLEHVAYEIYSIFKRFDVKFKSIRKKEILESCGILDECYLKNMHLRLRILKQTLSFDKDYSEDYHSLVCLSNEKKMAIFCHNSCCSSINKILRQKRKKLDKLFIFYRKKFDIIYKNKTIRVDSVEMSLMWILKYLEFHRSQIFVNPNLTMEFY